MRRIAATAVASLLGAAVAASAQDWRAGVDPRVELMSILFRLAGNQEYLQCRVAAYDQTIEKHFAPYRDHEAVQLARSLGIGLDAPMKLAVNLHDAESLDEITPFDGLHLYEGWNVIKAREFLTAARRFATEAHFQDFIKSQQPLYSATDARLRTFIRDKADLEWFDRFFGPTTPVRLVIVPGLANGASSYAVRAFHVIDPPDIYAIPGVSKVNSAGLPVFDAEWRHALVQQLSNIYASPAAGKLAERTEQAAGRIYAQVAAAMQEQSYGNWRLMLNASLARATAIEYVIEHDGREAALKEIRQENAKSLFWMGRLVDLLEAYRKDRVHYPDFELFVPRVAEFFNDLAPNIQQLVDSFQPRILSTSISDGAHDVDPHVKSIAVRFSMPMNPVAPDKIAKSGGVRFDAAAITLIIPVALAPDRDYEIPLRWPGGRPLVSAAGVPLPATLLKFRTAASRKP